MNQVIHINFACRIPENWDLYRHKLGGLFRKEPFGNFIDIYDSDLERVTRMLSDNFPRVELRNHSAYQKWIQIYDL